MIDNAKAIILGSLLIAAAIYLKPGPRWGIAASRGEVFLLDGKTGDIFACVTDIDAMRTRAGQAKAFQKNCNDKD